LDENQASQGKPVHYGAYQKVSKETGIKVFAKNGDFDIK
jgi:hypothetical protein